MNDLKQAIENYKETFSEFSELQQQNQRCAKNVNAFIERKNQLSDLVQGLEEDRKQILNKVATGQAESADLAKVNEMLQRKSSELAEVIELYEAAARGLKDSRERMGSMNSGVLSRRKEVIWSHVSAKESEEAKSLDGLQMLRRGFLAYRQSGRGSDFVDYLKETFGHTLFDTRYWAGDELAAMNSTLKRKYRLPFD